MSIRGWVLSGAITLFPSSVPAVAQVLLFGGGPTPYESQASIELNTQWIRAVLERQHPDAVIHTLYTDGNEPGVDVRSWSPVEDKPGMYQPLANVFGAAAENGYRYHSSYIAADTAASDYATVTRTLETLVADSRAGDELLLIYQGHGAYAPDTGHNNLLLWGGTSLTVTELEALLSAAVPGTTIRFVLPQCFSGAFTRLIYTGARPENGLAQGLRCGFVSQQEDRASEGCTDSVETGDYRDYSSYFFGALDGRARDGSPLAGEPDRNGDGEVTLREAHFYTLENAYSVDYSRSTSQDYLEHWQPWYLRWLPFPAEADNVYSRIAARLAARYALPVASSQAGAAAAAKLQELGEAIAGLEQEVRDLTWRVRKARDNIQRPLLMRWPALQSPYTAGFREIMRQELPAVQQVILAQEDYPALVADQERLAGVQQELLDARRDRVQLDKLLWMHRLARILAQFERFASAQDREEYDRLVQCEDVPL
jgi:hypothetical protein